VSSAEEQAIVLRIIEVLTPSITNSVRKALASRVQTVQVQTVQAPVVAVSQQNFAANQQASFGSSVSSSANQQASYGSSSSSSSSSSVNSSKLVAQIIAALQPSIAVSVQDALDAQSQAFNAQSQAFNSQNQAFNSQSQSFNTQSASSSGSLSSESLSGIFGNGGVHNVKIETPEYNIEYNN